MKLKARLACLLLAVLLAAAPLTVPALAEDGPRSVVRSTMSLTIDGMVRHGVEIYNIDGETYYRLRDLAMLLGGTRAEFGVSYDEAARSISVTRGAEYRPVGGELDAGADRSAHCQLSTQTLLIDGVQTVLRAYNLAGTNFYRLRDLGPALGFGVGYDASRRVVLVDTHSAVTRVRLGSSEYFLTLSEDYAPRQTGGYQSKTTGLTFDIYELNGVSDLRALAESDAAASHTTVTITSASGFELYGFRAGNSEIRYLDAGDGLCEKLVFQVNGSASDAVEEILRSLSRPRRVRLGEGAVSLYLPDSFSEAAPSNGPAGQVQLYTDAAAKRFAEVMYFPEASNFDAFVSNLGKAYGGGIVQDYSLIIKYFINTAVPAEQKSHGVGCCMPCAIRLGGSAASVIFWAEDANFGWAQRILRTLSAA